MEEKRKPTETFVTVRRDDTGPKKQYTTIFCTWVGDNGKESWTFDSRLTEEDLVSAYRESKSKTLWLNKYKNDTKYSKSTNGDFVRPPTTRGEPW